MNPFDDELYPAEDESLQDDAPSQPWTEWGEPEETYDESDEGPEISEEDEEETCRECGYDHEAEDIPARDWHHRNPCLYCVYEFGLGHGPSCPLGGGA